MPASMACDVAGELVGGGQAHGAGFDADAAQPGRKGMPVHVASDVVAGEQSRVG
jgi:hypothetical protein